MRYFPLWESRTIYVKTVLATNFQKNKRNKKRRTCTAGPFQACRLQPGFCPRTVEDAKHLHCDGIHDHPRYAYRGRSRRILEIRSHKTIEDTDSLLHPRQAPFFVMSQYIVHVAQDPDPEWSEIVFGTPQRTHHTRMAAYAEPDATVTRTCKKTPKTT